MTFMRRLESELAELRARVDKIAPPSRQIAAPEPSDEVAELRRLLTARDLELERHRRNSPDAAMRILEEQRDQAREDAANARADLSIQAAELETKDTLIATLERALETQHQSLRSLEERFAEYASRLQEIRFDRMNSSTPGGPAGDSSPGLLALFRQVFSRPGRPVADQQQTTEEASQ